MSITVTCACGKRSQFPNNAAGRHGKCHACGTINLITDLAASQDAFLDVVVPPASPSPAIRVDIPKPPRPTIPREPWYYGYILVYAQIVIGLGVFQFALVMIGIALMVGRSLNRTVGHELNPLHVVAPFCASFLFLLLVLLFVAPLFLAVDAARNLRAMRYRVEGMGQPAIG